MERFCCRPAKIGSRGRKRMPSSGRYMDFEVIDGGSGYPMVQLYTLPTAGGPRFREKYSFPITIGEAGIYLNQHGPFPAEADCYYYPHEFKDSRPDSDPLAEIMGNVEFQTFSFVVVRLVLTEQRAAA